MAHLASCGDGVYRYGNHSDQLSCYRSVADWIPSVRSKRMNGNAIMTRTNKRSRSSRTKPDANTVLVARWSWLIGSQPPADKLDNWERWNSFHTESCDCERCWSLKRRGFYA